MSKKVTQADIAQQIAESIGDIKELLRKSLPEFEKAQEEEDEGQMPPAPEGHEAPEAAPESPEAPEGQESPEAAPEGQEDQEGEGEDELAQHISTMSDEDLQMLMEAVMAESQKRQAQPAPQDAPPPPAAEPAEKAMKDEYLKLTKSLDEMAKAIAVLSKEVATVKAQPLKKSGSVSRAADYSAAPVVEKVVPAAERLSKSDTIEALIAAQRRGDPNVTHHLVAAVNSCKSTEELHKIQDSLKVKGIIK